MTIGTWHKNKWWAEYATEILPTGSRVICDPPPKGTDEDFLLLVDKETVPKLEERLKSEGFTVGGSMAIPKKPNIFSSHYPGKTLWDEPEQETPEWTWTGKTKINVDGLKLWQYRYMPELEDPVSLEEYPDWSDPTHKGVFHSFKNKDGLNLIITCSEEYFTNFWKATKLATNLNLLKKPDRVMLFESICFDKWPEVFQKPKKSNTVWGDIVAAAPAPMPVWQGLPELGEVHVVVTNIGLGPAEPALPPMWQGLDEPPEIEIEPEDLGVELDGA